MCSYQPPFFNFLFLPTRNFEVREFTNMGRWEAKLWKASCRRRKLSKAVSNTRDVRTEKLRRQARLLLRGQLTPRKARRLQLGHPTRRNITDVEVLSQAVLAGKRGPTLFNDDKKTVLEVRGNFGKTSTRARVEEMRREVQKFIPEVLGSLFDVDEPPRRRVTVQGLVSSVDKLIKEWAGQMEDGEAQAAEPVGDTRQSMMGVEASGENGSAPPLPTVTSGEKLTQFAQPRIACPEIQAPSQQHGPEQQDISRALRPSAGPALCPSNNVQQHWHQKPSPLLQQPPYLYQQATAEQQGWMKGQPYPQVSAPTPQQEAILRRQIYMWWVWYLD